MGKFRRLFREEDGNFGIMTALLMVLLLGVAGLALDFTNATRVKMTVQGIADSATLSVTREIVEKGLTIEAAEVTARKLVDAQLKSENLDLAIKSFELTRGGDGVVSLDVGGEVRTTLLKAIGHDVIPVAVSSGASMGAGAGVEIAIAFDATNSMGFGTSWKDAIEVIGQSLNALKQKSGGMALTFIPFTDRVNIGPSRTALLSPSDETAARTGSWGGCVKPRLATSQGVSEYYMNDAPPKMTDRFGKLDNWTPAGYDTGYRLACNPMAIIGPTSNVSHVTSELPKLTRGGTGRFDKGLVWAWRALSPNWQGYWKAGAPKDSLLNLDIYPQSTSAVSKIAVLVTDGLTTAYTVEFGRKAIWGWNNGTIEHFENLGRICADMAAQGIKIHVMHVNGNRNAEPYFRKCASYGGGYHQVGSKQQLIDAFAAATSMGGSLRLIH